MSASLEYVLLVHRNLLEYSWGRFKILLESVKCYFEEISNKYYKYNSSSKNHLKSFKNSVVLSYILYLEIYFLKIISRDPNPKTNNKSRCHVQTINMLYCSLLLQKLHPEFKHFELTVTQNRVRNARNMFTLLVALPYFH